VPHDVFISYSSIDKAAAFAACATFEAAQIRCWIAPRDVAAGAEWAEQIIEAIEAAKIMVLIFSSNSNESRQVKREIELAVSRGLTIMPIRLEKIAPTKSMAYYMAGVHWLDALTPPLDAHFKQMVGWIKPHLAGGPASELILPKARPRAEPRPKVAEPKAAPPPVAPEPATPREKSFGKTMFDIFFGGGSGEAGTPEAPKPQASRPSSALPAVPGLRPEQDTLSGLFNVALDFERHGKHEESILAYRRLIAAFDKDDRPLFREQVIRSFYNAGNSLRALGRHAEALASFEEALRRADGREEEGIRETVARILFNKANALDTLERKRDAIAQYEAVIERFGNDVDGMGRELAGRSMFTKAILTAALGQEDEAIKTYDQYLVRYGNDAAHELWVAESMFNIGAAHGVKGRGAEAVAAYERMLARFRGAKEPAVNAFVAMALYNCGNRLSDLKKPAEAIKCYDELIKTFGEDPRMPDRIAKGMVNRANQLGILGKRKEANAGYQAVIDKFSGSRDAGVQQQVTNARNWKK
jgi:tetratricopeptide (TPR) repeat protein